MKFRDIAPHPDSSPYQLAGKGEAGKVGVLLVHGFTASPTETRPLARYLWERTGWECQGVLLAGHGRTIEDLHQTSRLDWLKSARQGLGLLERRGCEHIFLAGVSMGSCLCCCLAAQHQDSPIRGLVLMAPAFALPFGYSTLIRAGAWFRRNQYKGDAAVEYFKRHNLFSYPERPLPLVKEVVRLGAQAMRSLSRIRCPALMLTGAKDGMISKRAVAKASKRMPGCRVVGLENSGHLLTVEPDAERAFRESLDFMRECLGLHHEDHEGGTKG